MNTTHVPYKMYPLSKLENLELGKNTKPASLEINGASVKVKNWTNLMERLVSALVEDGYLKENQIPIHNHAEGNKYLINKIPQHKAPEKNGSWKKINNFYVDVKYNAEAHRKNIVYLSQKLALRDRIDINISFH